MQVSETKPRLSPSGVGLSLAGLGVLIVATYSYASELSRAVSDWTSPVGWMAMVLSVASLRGYEVPRRAKIKLGAVTAALLVLGLATWIDAAAHPPMST